MPLLGGTCQNIAMTFGTENYNGLDTDSEKILKIRLIVLTGYTNTTDGHHMTT